MNSIDLVTILGNISQSLYPVQHLITGAAYMLGILFAMTAISKLMKIGGSASSSSKEHMYTPMMYLFIGAVLLYLPSALHVAANTAFGVGNVLTYATASSSSIYSNMGLIMQTAGMLWFVRGCVLVAHSSHPGEKHGPKGLAFICAGILSMNFDNSVSMLNSAMNYVTTLTKAVASSQGY